MHDFNAAAGPLPVVVRARVSDACKDWKGLGSVLSLSFASRAGVDLMRETQEKLVSLLDIPGSHEVLFMQGGASAQFGLVPANLLRTPQADVLYVDSGLWSRRAIVEARRRARVHTIDGGPLFDSGATDEAWARALRTAAPDSVSYVHLTSNETADGRQCPRWPACGPPLVVDMTSDILTRRVDWSRVALGYAALQKIIGVAGLTVVIVRRDLVETDRPVPRVFEYALQAKSASRLNTPPLFAIFVANAMLDWIRDRGGVAAVEATIQRHSTRVYRLLDGGAPYRVEVRGVSRSRTSVCFAVSKVGGNDWFLEAACARGLTGLHGHAESGGLRLAIYPGTSEDAIDSLCGFLQEFGCRRDV